MGTRPAALADQVIAKTREYLRVPAVVGFERPFLDYLRRQFVALGGLRVERRKNLLIVEGRSEARTMFSSHIDRHGIVCTGPNEFQYAAHVARRIRYNEHFETSTRFVQTMLERYAGEPVHAYEEFQGHWRGRGVIRHAYLDAVRNHLMFEVEGLEAVPPRTPVHFASDCWREDGYVSGQLDNALNAAVLYVLFAHGFRGKAFFAAEEEIGKSWEHLHGYLVERQIESREFLVLDTSPYPDAAAPDAGVVVLRHRDNNGAFNAPLVDRLAAICEAAGIAYDFKDEFVARRNAELADLGRPPLSLGNTELGRLVAGTGGACNGATIQVPTFNYHSNRESTTPRAIAYALTLLMRVVGLDA